MYSEDWFKNLFYARYADFCRIAYRYVADKDACEDIVQECFIRFWERRNEITSDNPAAYLSIAVKNSCISYLRKRQNTLSIDDENVSLQLADISAEEQSNKPSAAEIAEQALAELPDRCRLVFSMSRIEKKTYQEIATELQLSVKTVENQMGKAIKMMRQYVRKHPELFFLVSLLLKYEWLWKTPL